MFSGVALVSVTGMLGDSLVIAAAAVAIFGFSLLLNSASELLLRNLLKPCSLLYCLNAF
jgi:hypothetical protein